MIVGFFHLFIKFLRRIRNRFARSAFIEDSIFPFEKEAVVKECTRDAQTRKRVADSFKAQRDQMNARALKPHGDSCRDPLICKQGICFKSAPDKIVSKSYKVDKKMCTNVSMGDYKKAPVTSIKKMSNVSTRLSKTINRKKISQ